jgi:hypothetical protein
VHKLAAINRARKFALFIANCYQKRTRKPIKKIVAQGALIQYAAYPVIATIGYLELWSEHQALFFNEVGDSSTGQQHILECDEMEIRGDQAILYRDGEVVASIAPYDDFNVDVDWYKSDWQEWLSWQSWRRPLDGENAKEYRSSFHPV